MRFWASLILGSALISFLVTFLTMNKGGQLVIQAPPTRAKAIPPNLVFELDPGNKNKERIVGNVIEMIPSSAGRVGELYQAAIFFKNDGEGPFLLELESTSCTCVEVLVDNVALVGTSRKATIPPKGRSRIEIRWKPRDEDLRLFSVTGADAVHYKATFNHNDSRFLDPITIDVKTLLSK